MTKLRRAGMPAAIFLLLCISACTPSSVIRVPEIHVIRPSPIHLQATPVPELTGPQAEALIAYVLNLKNAVLSCNVDKHAAVQELDNLEGEFKSTKPTR